MIILGLNAYHGDSSACILRDGKLIAAAEEERFRRIKHWAGLPSESVRFCLKEAGVRLGDVDHIAINKDPKANLWRRLFYVATKRPDFGLVAQRFRNVSKAARIDGEIARAFPGESLRARMHFVEHHLSHLASAFLVSPFEKAVVVSVDGFGDFASAVWGVGDGADIRIDGRVFFPHSLGIFYSALTQFIGFPFYGDEYKVMGLAPYGEPKFLDEMRKIVLPQDDGSFRLDLRFFRHATENVSYQWNDCTPDIGTLFAPALELLLGPARKKTDELTQKHKDIARSVQAMYEEAFFHLLGKLHARTGCDALALSGGCAMNSVANGKIHDRSPFKHAFIPAAAGDAGGAIGAAFVAWHRVSGQGRTVFRDSAYLGPKFSDDDFAELLKTKHAQIESENCVVQKIDDEAALCAVTADAIANGEVIGWFQGRMEWGPRALGNRSILGDPRRADMKDILNKKIKRRESFRPFAPSVLREAAAEWFERDDDVPFMMKVFQIKPEKRAQIPAVTHVDGSGRLQTVSREDNPRYHALISAFQKQAGVPMVLNTSFNENEPVVCRPEEALDCFLRTKMDVLVLGNFFIRRASSAA